MVRVPFLLLFIYLFMACNISLDQIQQLKDIGYSRKEISQHFNISESTVSAIVRKHNSEAKIFKAVQGTDSICEVCSKKYVVNRFKGDRATICNYCVTKKRIEFFKKYCVEIAGSACCYCGYDRCQYVIEYHHVKDKLYAISNCINTYGSKSRLHNELLKCIPFCANCHREFHQGLFGYRDIDRSKLKDYQIKLIDSLF